MNLRLLSLWMFGLLTPVLAAAQNGQGANARPDATPPTRPSGPTPAPPAGRPTLSGPRIQNLLLIYPTSQAAMQPPKDEFGKGAYKTDEPGLVPPIPIQRRNPIYTSAAISARIEGTVEVEAVILQDGIVGDARIARSLDQTHGLDDAALAAAKQWTFKPGTINGRPVPVVVTLALEFRLSSTPPVPRPGVPAPAVESEFGKNAHKAGEPGLVQPVRKQADEPIYTPAALRAKIQGTVTLEAVVLADGTVGEVRVTTSLDKDYGLDAAAVAAVKQWTFEPGTLNGQPVSVLVSVTAEFRLRQ